MKYIRWPKSLKKGDTIGIISPSWCGAGLFPHRFRNGINQLLKLGFNSKVARNALSITNYTAGSPIDRATDVNNMFKDKKIKAILCTIGGNHSNQLLQYLNWKVIKNNPKIFVGFSDITVLQIAMYSKTRLVTFYGPQLLNQFAEYPNMHNYTRDYFLKATSTKNSIGHITPSDTWTDEVLDWAKKLDLKRPRKMKTNEGWIWLKKGTAKGKLLGGCISSLMHLRGTEYWPSFKNTIFFWEIPEGETILKGESVATIDSYLTDLQLSSVFNQIQGMIIGRPYRYSKKEITLLKEIILKRTYNYNFPILFNVNFGHTDPIITIPIGVEAKIDSTKNDFIIMETATS